MSNTTAVRSSSSDTSGPDSTRRASSAVRAAWPIFVALALLAGLVAAAISQQFLGESLALLGLPDPGKATTIGLPLFRGAGWIVLSLALGSFMLAAFGPRPNADGDLALDGHLASRTGTYALVAWALLAIGQIPMVLSDVSGSTLAETLKPDMWFIALEQISEARAWAWVAGIALFAAFFAGMSHRWIWQPVYFALTLLSMVPLFAVGHNAAGGDHDIGTNSLIIHLVLMALWIGGLMAMLAHGMRRGADMDVVVNRYSFVALIAFFAMAVSGVVNALLKVRIEDLFSMEYGNVLVAKTVLLIVLGIFGFAHRQRTIPRLKKDPYNSGAFRKVAIGELVIMAVTAGLAVTLTRTPPPPPRDPNLSVMDIELGFPLFEPANWANIFLMWRIDMFFSVASAVAAAIYLYWYIKLIRRGGQWPIHRVLWWVGGCFMLFFTTCSGLGMYGMAMFSWHMLAHMSMSMLIPVMLVQGGVITLALRALEPAGKNGVPGIREWLVAFINNPVSRFLTHPITAAVQFVSGFYLLYLTPLYDLMVDEHLGHLFMNIHFLISGYIFYWVAIGVDAAPRQVPPYLKLVTVLGTLPFHAWFGIILMQSATPIGLDFYQKLDLPFYVDLLQDQNWGGAVAWGAGEVPLIIVALALCVQWLNQDRKESKRFDRQEERSGDAELNAYNEMLARLSGQTTDAEPAEQDYYNQEVTSFELRPTIDPNKSRHQQH
ncbi:cytochrome c oxidase assembly protein [Corynebacterium ulceribovis]|uniref:cytochrome c oxidase assembly protein n=1 Tax=Corynebacterium ulceribovis TaxID=487732 RepID=UPI000A03C2DE|nr:cytochrome c oxidase assembly protein [Corynebacterium ulceribovis]